MERLAEFWAANRNEILVTAFAIVCIQTITSLGGFVKRVGGAKRVAGTGLASKPEDGRGAS